MKTFLFLLFVLFWVVLPAAGWGEGAISWPEVPVGIWAYVFLGGLGVVGLFFLAVACYLALVMRCLLVFSVCLVGVVWPGIARGQRSVAGSLEIPFTGVPWGAVPFWVWGCLGLVVIAAILLAVVFLLDRRDYQKRIISARNLGRYAGSTNGRAVGRNS